LHFGEIKKLESQQPIAEENPKVVAERLGHSTVVLTLDTYSHVLPTMQKVATDKFG
jgi:integrase